MKLANGFFNSQISEKEIVVESIDITEIIMTNEMKRNYFHMSLGIECFPHLGDDNTKNLGFLLYTEFILAFDI